MKLVGKYNIYKGVSTLLTIGTPIVTLLSCSELFVHRADTAISSAGVFTILLCCLFLKDKIAENLKMPSAFVVSAICLVLLLIVESIIRPLKYVCIATLCTSGIDELTFKRFYKSIEAKLPANCDSNKILGFMFTSTDKILGDNYEQR